MSRHSQVEIELRSIAGLPLYQKMEALAGNERTNIEMGCGLFTVTVTELEPIYSGQVGNQTQSSTSPSLRRKLGQDSLRLHIPHPITLETPTPPTGSQNRQTCSNQSALFWHNSSQVLRRSRGVADLRSQSSGNIDDALSIATASSSFDTHSTTTLISILDLHLHEPTIEHQAKIAIRFTKPVLVSVTDARPEAYPAAKQRTRSASYRLRETSS